MPKISDERRAERRAQIVQAAWTCFHREGPQATTMDDIIAASGLSAGAVYGYFRSKDDLVVAALGAALSGLREAVAPLFDSDPVAPPDEFVRQAMALLVSYSARDGCDLRRIAVFGWGEAQRNARMLDAMRGFYLGFREQLAGAAGAWRRDGLVADDASADDLAKLLLSLVLGFVIQSVILGDVAPEAAASGLRSLRGGRTRAGAAARRPGRPAAT